MLRALLVGALSGMALTALGQPGKDPGGGPGDGDGFDQRFPQKPPAGPDPARSVVPSRQAAPDDRAGSPEAPQACNGVDPKARLSCPLLGRVIRIQDVPGGVRLTVRERGLPADKLHAVLACQAGMAAARSDVPPACSFLEPAPEVLARKSDKRGLAVIDLLWPAEDEGTLGVQRTRTRTALQGR
jgi:hypothetical protein